MPWHRRGETQLLLQHQYIPALKAEASTVHMITISCSPPNCQYCSATQYSPHPVRVRHLLSLPEQIFVNSYTNKGGWVGTKQTKKSDNTDSIVRSQIIFDT